MIQEMSVLGRIKKFERMAQRNRAAAAAGPAAKSKISAQIMANKKSPEERAEALTGFIKAANQTLGNLSDRVAGTLAEKNLGGGGSGSYLHQSTRYSRTNVLTASSGPRVIDTGRGPRGNVRPLSTSQVKSFSPTPLEAAFKSVRLRRVHNSVAELDLSPTYFGELTVYQCIHKFKISLRLSEIIFSALNQYLIILILCRSIQPNEAPSWLGRLEKGSCGGAGG